MAPSHSSCRWSAKQYILAALIGTQVAIIIAIVFSVILSPAHINLAIANARVTPGGPDNRDSFYNFTLVSNNNSTHKKVKYGAINFEIWYIAHAFSVADLASDKLPQGWQRALSSTNISVTAPYLQWDTTNMSRPSSLTSGNVVVVTAQAHFKIGTIPTRQYKIRVLCQPVYFSFSNFPNSPVNCTG